MTQAQLSITLPDGTWVKDVSTAHPEATVSVLAAMPGDDVGFALIRVVGPDLDSFLVAMNEHRVITELTTIQRSENEATIQFETTAPLLLFSSKESGMPIELPVEIRDGVATVDVTGSNERLSELGDQLRAFGLEFEVEYIRERLHSNQLLSERQRELVATAIEHGYYDTPRSCSLTELAEELDIAKSTCSGVLHRAEETIIKYFAEDLPEVDESGELSADPTDS